jgi:hypothetical protein
MVQCTVRSSACAIAVGTGTQTGGLHLPHSRGSGAWSVGAIIDARALRERGERGKRYQHTNIKKRRSEERKEGVGGGGRAGPIEGEALPYFFRR